MQRSGLLRLQITIGAITSIKGQILRFRLRLSLASALSGWKSVAGPLELPLVGTRCADNDENKPPRRLDCGFKVNLKTPESMVRDCVLLTRCNRLEFA
jgi:hypothetical protein